MVREDACRSTEIKEYARNKTRMHASCDLPPEPQPLKGVRARGSPSGEAEEAAIYQGWRLLLSHLPPIPHAPTASSPIPLTGSAHQFDEWVRGEANSGQRRDEAAENRGTRGRKREEAGAGSLGFYPHLRIHHMEAEPKHLFIVAKKRERIEAKTSFFKLIFHCFQSKTNKNRPKNKFSAARGAGAGSGARGSKESMKEM